MLKSLITYGGIATKTRAMYGRRLRREDYEHLASLQGVSEIAAYLKKDPGFSHLLRGLNEAEVHRAELEQYLREGYWDEFVRIASFVVRDDRKTIELGLIRSEISIIMAYIRHLNSTADTPFVPGVTSRQAAHSSIDFQILRGGGSYDDLLKATASCSYHEVLVKCAPQNGGNADYTRVESALDAFMYGMLLKAYEQNAGRRFADVMKGYLGMQIDLVNIARVVRVRKYFTDSFDSLYALLIPSFHRVDLAFFRSLFTARTDDELDVFLQMSPYRRVFARYKYSDIERYVHEALYDFNRAELRKTPSLLAPVCYLQLKEIEMQNIIRTIECVRYGLEPHQVLSYLVGIGSGTPRAEL